MHVAAREVEAKGRAHEAGGEPRCTHYSLELWYTVSPLVYSKTDHSFFSALIYRMSRSKRCWQTNHTQPYKTWHYWAEM